MRRRKKRSALDGIILGAAKQIRKQRLEFEREASKALSDALGFLVVVKIQKRSPTEGTTLDMRRAMRRPPSEIRQLVLDQLAPLEKPEGAALVITPPPEPPANGSRTGRKRRPSKSVM